MNVKNENNETPLQTAQTNEAAYGQKVPQYKEVVEKLKSYRSKEIASKLNRFRATD